MHGFTDLQTQFCWKLIYMYVIRWSMSEIFDLTKNSISNCNLRQHAIFLQIYLCALFWLIYYIHHVNNCIQLTTLWPATISNTIMCTLHDFFSSKVKFIYTSTVTRSHSCYGKNYAYASRTSCSYNINPSKKIVRSKDINIYSKMYQMTLFFKKSNI